MRDHYDARLWNDGHEEVHASVDRLLRRIMQAFHVLHRIHWAAPWTCLLYTSPSPRDS